MITAADFRTAFPEFTSTTTYPGSQVDFWIAQGYAQLNAASFGAQLDLAVMLFVAHNVVLSARAAATAAKGQVVGASTGVVSSKSLGPGSMSYDTTLATYADAGIWNATIYGQRLYQMMRAYSAGPKYAPSWKAARNVWPYGWPR